MKPFFVAGSEQARQADAAAIQTLHIPSLVLMENAARSVFERIQTLEGIQTVALVCGPGNNGADGLALARMLADAGYTVRIFLDETKLSNDEAVQLSIVKAMNLPVMSLADFSAETPADLIVDALFGNGLSRPVTGIFADMVQAINASPAPVLAVDIASGIDANTGHILENAVKADYTVALDCLKWGHLLNEGRSHAGAVSVSDIGIPDGIHKSLGSIQILDESLAAQLLPVRNEFGNKGTFGKVLMAGGSFAMQGALAMAADACFHCGCGTLSLFTPEPAARAIASKMDLAMILAAPAEEEGFFKTGSGALLSQKIAPFSQLSCGNGMGTGEGALEVLKQILQAKAPAVIDADGINLLAKYPDLLEETKKPLILSPHLLEFARLMDLSLQDVKDHPLDLARDFVHQHPNTVLVLKSDFTLVVSSEKELVLNRPDDALAKGGSGDVLCGIITGLASLKMEPFAAAALGAYVHNAAAKAYVSPFSFTPLDLIANLGTVFARLQSLKENDQK